MRLSEFRQVAAQPDIRAQLAERFKWYNPSGRWPNLESAVEQFGIDGVGDYIEALVDWAVVGSSRRSNPQHRVLAFKLLRGISIGRVIDPSGWTASSQFLWRGMFNLKSVPHPGQSVSYSEKIRPSSWTENRQLAKVYCESTKRGSGILLGAKAKHILSQRVFVWPFQGELSRIMKFEWRGWRQQEWAIIPRTSIPCPIWTLCESKTPKGRPSDIRKWLQQQA